MDAHDRQLMIERLQRENAEACERIAERIARRERDPSGELERLMADQRFTHDQADLIYTSPAEPEPSPPVGKSGDQGLVYRRYDGAQPAARAEPGGDWSGWETWMQGHLDILRQEMIDGVAEGIMTLIQRERDAFDRKLAALKAESIELKGMLGDALKRCDQVNDKLKNLIADVDGERRDHISRMTAFQVEVAELRGRVCAVLRDWTT
jgi:hypothetical protein